MSCSMDLVWELEKIDIDNATDLLKVATKENINQVALVACREVWNNICHETKGYFFEKMAYAYQEILEQDVQRGILSEGEYLEQSNAMCQKFNRLRLNYE